MSGIRPIGGRRRGWLLARSATLAIMSLVALAPSASAHVAPPTVTALHAFIGDPLWGLNTTQGSLFGIAPDERTAMASTTKLMTLDVTLQAVEDGVVSLDDQVVVDPFAASIEPPNSVMAGINGVDLEPGEVVKLETLIRGMMYPSGNDAAWAIAYHVANAYGADLSGDGVVDGRDFVVRMNQHALAMGLTNTHFTSPNGWDDPTTPNPAPGALNHYTTARELSMIIDHGLNAHPHFGEVIGFQGTYTDTSKGPNGPKTYSWTWGSSYPGWEGQKGGSTQNCNGLAGRFCLASSARRIGRRVVFAFMQGVGGSEIAGLFNYGFARIFHPDPRGSSASVGAALRDHTLCPTSSRCVSAVLPASGDVRLVSWQSNIDGSAIGVLDQKGLPGSSLPPKGGQGAGPSGDVAVTQLPSGAIILASRKGSSVELSRWSMDGGGALTLLASGIKAGPATTIALQPAVGEIFLSAVTDPDGALVVKSWKLNGSSLVNLDTFRDGSRIYSEVSMAGPQTADVSNNHRAVTASIAPGLLVHDVWGVDPATGVISRLGELAEAGSLDKVHITPISVKTVKGELVPPSYYATALRYSSGYAIFFFRIDASGTPVDEGAVSTFSPVEDVDVAPLGVGGVMSASRDGTGAVELRAWEALRNSDNTISPDQVSQHTASDPTASLDLVQVPSSHAEGDYVTAVTDPVSGELRLRGYRSGSRPY